LPGFALDCLGEARKSKIHAICLQAAGGNFFAQATQHHTNGICDGSLAFAGNQARQLTMPH
jgi:hypothetical protein